VNTAAYSLLYLPPRALHLHIQTDDRLYINCPSQVVSIWTGLVCYRSLSANSHVLTVQVIVFISLLVMGKLTD